MRPRIGPLLLAAAVAWSCSPVAVVPVATPSSPAIGRFATATREHDVTVEARGLAWPGAPHDLEDVCTPLLVRVTSDRARPIALSSDSFALLSGRRPFARVFPDQIPGATAEMAAAALKPAVLERGDGAAGFVYFEHLDGSFGPLTLRVALLDPDDGALIDTIDVPFRQQRLTTCSLARADEVTPWWSGQVFDTCLLPQ